jgi:hypothetical protein
LAEGRKSHFEEENIKVNFSTNQRVNRKRYQKLMFSRSISINRQQRQEHKKTENCNLSQRTYLASRLSAHKQIVI